MFHGIGIEGGLSRYEIEIGSLAAQVAGDQQGVFIDIDRPTGGDDENGCVRVLDDPAHSDFAGIFAGRVKPVALAVKELQGADVTITYED